MSVAASNQQVSNLINVNGYGADWQFTVQSVFVRQEAFRRRDYLYNLIPARHPSGATELQLDFKGEFDGIWAAYDLQQFYDRYEVPMRYTTEIYEDRTVMHLTVETPNPNVVMKLVPELAELPKRDVEKRRACICVP